MGASAMRYVRDPIRMTSILFINNTYITLHIDKNKNTFGTLLFESEMKDTFYSVINDARRDNKHFRIYYYDNVIHHIDVESETNCWTGYSSSYVTPDSFGPEYTPPYIQFVTPSHK